MSTRGKESRLAWARIPKTASDMKAAPISRSPLSGAVLTLQSGSIAVATALIVSFLVVGLGRLFYPYELEWMEGGSVDHVRWLLAGHPLYVRPTLAFIPYIYTPVYYYLASVLCWFVGVGFWPLRAISIGATLLTLVVLYQLLRHEIRSRYAAYLGVAFYAGTFPLTGYWLDLARVDSLEILFLALAIYSVRRQDSTRAAVVAGLSVSLAALTKQPGIAAVLPIGLYLAVCSRRRLAVFLLTVGLGLGGGFLALDRLNHGWLRYYTITLPSSHEAKASAVLEFWSDDVVRLLPLGIALGLAGWLARRQDKPRRSNLSFYGLVLLVLLVTSYSSRIHAGGEKNVIMPAFLGAALGFAIVTHFFRSRKVWPHLFALLQLSLLLYLPWKQLPSPSDRLAGDTFSALLGRLDGEVYLMDHGYYPARAGKRTFAQGMAVVDVLRADQGPAGQALAAEMTAAVGARRFAAIIVGTTVPQPGALDDSAWNDGIQLPWMPAGFLSGIEVRYAPAMHLFHDSYDFAPIVGWRRRPAVVYLPRVQRGRPSPQP